MNNDIFRPGNSGSTTTNSGYFVWSETFRRDDDHPTTGYAISAIPEKLSNCFLFV